MWESSFESTHKERRKKSSQWLIAQLEKENFLKCSRTAWSKWLKENVISHELLEISKHCRVFPKVIFCNGVSRKKRSYFKMSGMKTFQKAAFLTCVVKSKTKNPRGVKIVKIVWRALQTASWFNILSKLHFSLK